MYSKFPLTTLLILLCSGAFAEDALRSVNLQLKWDHQFQFAGYYAAQWKGFYAEEGLDVTFTPRVNPDKSLKTVHIELAEGRADFAIGGPDLLQYVDAGYPFVLLSSLYQRSPFSFVVLDQSDIFSVADLYQSCIGTTHDFGEMELKTLFLKEGFQLEGVNWGEFKFGLESLIDNSCPVVITYGVSAKWAAKEKDLKVRELKSEHFGIQFYGDVLYTRELLATQEPQFVEAFRKASMKGWQYALDHPNEIARMIDQKLNRVFIYKDNFEYNILSADEIRILTNYPITQLGHSNYERWKKIQSYLYEIGVVETQDLSPKFIFDYEKLQQNQLKSSKRILLYFSIVLVGVILIFGFLSWRKRGRESLLVSEKTQLLETQSLLNTILNLVPIKIYWKDKESRFIGGNQSFLEDCRLNSVEEIKGKKDSDMPWANLAELYRKDDLDVMNGGVGQFSGEIKFESARRGVQWVKSQKIPLKDSGGNVIGVLGSYQHITEFKEALAASNREKQKSTTLANRLKSLIDFSPDMIFYKDYLDTDGLYVICNGYFEEWLGLTERDIIGKKDTDLFSKVMAEQFRQEDLSILKTKQTYHKEMYLAFASGRQRLYDFVKLPVIGKDGRVEGVLGVARDITEERESRNIYDAVFTVSKDAYFVLGVDGAISNCNQAAVDMIGVSTKADLIGLRLIRDFTPERQSDGRLSVDVVKQANRNVNESDDGISLTHNFEHKDINGHPLYVDVFLARLGEPGHTPILVQWHDVSESKFKQDQLEQARKGAESLAQAKALFLANMSHEIRTPLNAIVGLSQLAVKSTDQDKISKYISNIHGSSHHLLQIVNDILDYSKLEADKVQLERLPVDIKHLVDQIVKMYLEQAEGKSLSLTSSWTENVPDQVLGDATRIKQILTNLVSNAIKFTENGSVEVSLDTDGEWFVLSVTDTGVGIDQSKLENLFDPFTQEDISTTRQYGGTGLGLSICHSLTQLMGGEIQVISQKTKGTTFSVRLPMVVTDAGIAPKQDTVLAPDLSNKRILIAEDNPLNQMVIEELLSETRAQLDIVNDGQAAVASIETKDYDLVLMDIQMPVLDGLSAVKKIREMGYGNLMVVALTANSGDDEKNKALGAGMNDFVTKPVDQAQLFSKLTYWLNPHP